jgi:hypothetical protein
MFSLKKRVAHSTRSSHKFSFVVHAGTASGFAAPAQGLPSGAQAVLQIARGPKVVASSPANIVMGKATWDAPLEFVCTLYSSKKIDKAFSEKTFRVSLMMLAERRRTVEIAAEEVDVAAFADQGVVEHRVSHIFSLTPLKAGKAGKAGAVLASDTLPVEVVAQVSSVYLKDLDVDPDEESISSVTPRASGLPGFVPGSTPSRAALEQDLRGFPAWDDDGGESDAGSVTSRAASVETTSAAVPTPSAPAAELPPASGAEVAGLNAGAGRHASADDGLAFLTAEPRPAFVNTVRSRYAEQQEVLSRMTAQLSELRGELAAAKLQAASVRSSAPQAASPAQPLMSSTGRAAELEAELEALRNELYGTQTRVAEYKVGREAAESALAHARKQADSRQAELEIALAAAQKRAVEADEATVLAVTQVELQKQRLQAELIKLSAEQGDMTIRFNQIKDTSQADDEALRTAQRAAAAASKRLKAVEAELARSDERRQKAMQQLKHSATLLEAEQAETRRLRAQLEEAAASKGAASKAAASKADAGDESLLSPPGKPPPPGKYEAGLASAFAEKDAELARLRAEIARLSTPAAAPRNAPRNDAAAAEAAEYETDDDEESEEDDDDALQDTDDEKDRGGDGSAQRPPRTPTTAQLQQEHRAAFEAAATAANRKAAATEAALRTELAAAGLELEAAYKQVETLQETNAFLQDELRDARQRLSVALADGARAGADVRMANAAAAAAVATAAAVAATSPKRVVASGGDASRDEVCAALENAAAEAANAARRAAEEAAELRVELVSSKLRAAEAEYELESVRGKLRKLKEKMEQYGGDHLESAQRATQMEVKLAQSLQEAARLRAENSQLQEDVKGMIELKLQLSESQAQLDLT